MSSTDSAVTSPFDDTVLSLTPDLYSPIRNDDGEFEDSLRGYKFQVGLRCGCGSKNVFQKRQGFMTHIQSKQHKDWISEMNRNAANYYNECVELRELTNSQKQIIARLENELMSMKTKLAAKDAVIMCLAEKMTGNGGPCTEATSTFAEIN